MASKVINGAFGKPKNKRPEKELVTPAPLYQWYQIPEKGVKKEDLMWQATIIVANIIIKSEPRPVPQFAKGERSAMLSWLRQALSEALFGIPEMIESADKRTQMVNPQWEAQHFCECVDGEWGVVEPRLELNEPLEQDTPILAPDGSKAATRPDVQQ